jgi:hypothetical protein
MNASPRRCCRLLAITIAASALGFLSLATAQDAPATAKDDAEAKQRLKLMQEAVESLQAKSTELKTKGALTPGDKPLLRYACSGLPNELLDAGIWRVGIEGRPTALITVELYKTPNDSRFVSYEFLALTEKSFSLSHKTRSNIHWEPAESGLVVKDLPDAPKPATTMTNRLVQMRALARRFTATEPWKKDPIDLRLMAQPIDRYQTDQPKIVDGAVFAFANGTNPEIGLLLETDGDNWRYGILRLTTAPAKVKLDEKEVVAYEYFNDVGKRTDWPYFHIDYGIPAEKR